MRRGRSLLLATFDNRHSRRKGQVAAEDIAVTAIRVALRRRLQRGKGGIEVDFEITALAAEAAAATAAADALQASDAPLELRLGGEVVVVTPSADGPGRPLVLGDARRTTDWDGVCALWERTFAGDLQVVALTLALPTLKRASCHTRTK